jgi:hypothetical protein
MKEAGLDAKRLDPAKFSNGSVEEWAYYQYGVPSFSMDFWTLPVKENKQDEGDAGLTPEKIEQMTNEEFIELGEEKIDEFLKANDAPSQFTGAMVINALKSGMMTTKKMAEYMKKQAKKEEAGGADETEQALWDYKKSYFVKWREYDHPTLGKIEIGGRIPYKSLAPPADSLKGIFEKQLPFVRELAALLPSIAIDKITIDRRGSDIWKIETWVSNNGFLPFPTHQGQRCKRPTPVVLTLDVDKENLLEGRQRVVAGLLGGSGGAKKVSWLVRGKEGARLKLEAMSFGAGGDEKTVILKGGGE